MDESDDDFRELCASFFQRVKKPAIKEVSGDKTLKGRSGTRINKLKKTKPTVPKTKILQGPGEKQPHAAHSDSQAPGAETRRETTEQQSELAVVANGEGDVLASGAGQPGLCDSAQDTPTESAPDSDCRPSPPCSTTATPSSCKTRTAELVLQRMQQFKRVDPERLKHAPEECSPRAALEDHSLKSPGEELTAGHGCEPALPATDSDAAMALALQQESGQEAASACNDSLEEKGLFFCQICQKNLSTMNVVRREQHMNRCLDKAEAAQRPPAPQIPECPICGKPFLTLKSRASHLKKCAVKMQVGPQLLLQAVRLQTAQPEAGGPPPSASISIPTGRSKRKGTSNRKEPRKRRKVGQPEAPSEDLLVAMALSRSEMEQNPTAPALRLESAFSERARPGAEKKSRKKKPPASPPQLLIQDSETTGRQIEDRVALLLSEEMEMSSTPQLPASRILKEESRKAAGKQNFLWEGSALTRAWAVESFYTANLVPPIMPQQPTKERPLMSRADHASSECGWHEASEEGPRNLHSKCMFQTILQEPPRPLTPEKPQPDLPGPPDLPSSPGAGHRAEDLSLTTTQRERQALQDLVDLVQEELSTSPEPSSGDMASSGGAPGLDVVPCSLPLTGFVLPPKERHPEGGDHALLSFGLLIADFSTMVNNPHLSDVQFQTDSGEVLYAHKFVLYARCPLLIQYVSSEGFSAMEDGVQGQRVLLSDVSTEALHALLRYLYTADTSLSPRLAPDLSSLALRFGVSDLVHLCQQVPTTMESEEEQWAEKEDESCAGRVENFQELLKSVWVDGEEEAETPMNPEDGEGDREQVNEAEMEEIYEFAATQRKLLQGQRATAMDEDSAQPQGDSPESAQILASMQGTEELETTEQTEFSVLGGAKASPHQDDTRQRTGRSLRGQRLRAKEAGTQEQEAPVESGSHCGSPSPSWSGWARGEVSSQSALVHRKEQAEFSEPSQTKHSGEQQSGAVRGMGAGLSQQAPPPHLSSPPSQHPVSRSPGQPCLNLHHTDVASSQSHGGLPDAASTHLPSPHAPSLQKRVSSVLTSLTQLEHKARGTLTTWDPLASIDLTQSRPEQLSSRAPSPPCARSQESEVILLSDSDEELGLEQAKGVLDTAGSPKERTVSGMSSKSAELFSVIDVDLEHSQSPPGGGAESQAEGLCERSKPADSTMDTSWLVPATPLVSRSHDCSSQSRIMSFRPRTPAGERAAHTPRARGAAHTFSVIVSQTQAAAHAPATSGASDGGGWGCGSPSRPHSRYPKHSSPLGPSRLGGGLPDFTWQFPTCSPPRPLWPLQAEASEVVEVEDSEGEQEAASLQAHSSPLLDRDPPVLGDDCSWHAEPLSPIPIDQVNLERTGPLGTSSPCNRAQEAPDYSAGHAAGLLVTPPTHGRKSPETSLLASSLGNSRPSFLNSALWDDWDGGEQRSPKALPAARTPGANGAQWSAASEMQKGDKQKKNLPPKVPITPMPRYSIMETPVLRKELDRFGVRPLPKRQMVLKLKEIFQYTHQTLESDSEDEIQASEVPLATPLNRSHSTETSKPAGTEGCTQLEAAWGPRPQSSKGPSKIKSPRHRKQQPKGGVLAPGQPADPEGDTHLPASQESVATSVDSSDSSFGSQSSSSAEFGAALESAGDEEEGISASQAAMPAADVEEAVRRYIRSTPALHRKVLLYQPLELAELQAELRQNGIRVATGKLLDILDTHCITFTTAAARKEKLNRKRLQRVGKKKGGQK